MTERWHAGIAPYGERVENPAIDAFLADIEAVCQKHQMSISHEDGGGAFIIRPYNRGDTLWLNAAGSEIDPKTPPALPEYVETGTVDD